MNKFKKGDIVLVTHITKAGLGEESEEYFKEWVQLSPLGIGKIISPLSESTRNDVFISLEPILSNDKRTMCFLAEELILIERKDEV